MRRNTMFQLAVGSFLAIACTFAAADAISAPPPPREVTPSGSGFAGVYGQHPGQLGRVPVHAGLDQERGGERRADAHLGDARARREGRVPRLHRGGRAAAVRLTQREDPRDRGLVAPPPSLRRLRAGRGLPADPRHAGERPGSRAPLLRGLRARRVLSSRPGITGLLAGARRRRRRQGARRGGQALGRLNDDGGGALGHGDERRRPERPPRGARCGRHRQLLLEPSRGRGPHDRPHRPRSVAAPSRCSTGSARRTRSRRSLPSPRRTRTRACAPRPATRSARSATRPCRHPHEPVAARPRPVRSRSGADCAAADVVRRDTLRPCALRASLRR